MILTTLEIAQIFDVLPRTVTVWGSDRGAPKVDKNQWDLKVFIQWWAENIYVPEDNEQSELYKIKLEHWVHRTRREKLKADQLEESVIPRDDVAKAWAFRVREVRGKLLAVALRLAPLLEGLEELEIREILMKEMWDICDQFSRKGRYSDEQAG